MPRKPGKPSGKAAIIDARPESRQPSLSVGRVATPRRVRPASWCRALRLGRAALQTLGPFHEGAETGVVPARIGGRARGDRTRR
jgi:hypothetical protein